MKILITLTISTFILFSCGVESSGNSTNKVEKLDQSKPEYVMQIIFNAAKSGNFSNLTKLCDDTIDNDKDAKQICSCGLADADKILLKSFQKYFSKGKVIGETKYVKDEAEVNFTFGPDGKTEETMRLTKKDGKWYLNGF